MKKIALLMVILMFSVTFILATQLAESFESTTFPPTGWSTTGWSRNTNATYVYNGIASASRLQNNTTAYILWTPLCTITTGSTLDFYYRVNFVGRGLQIVYSNDKVNVTQLEAFSIANTNWTRRIVNLNAAVGNRYLGFRTTTTGGANTIFIDYVFGPEIVPPAPGAVTLTTPADASTNQLTQPTFSWTPNGTGGTPTSYTLYCDTNANPTTVLATTAALSYTPTTPLAENTLYRWKVVAHNSGGSSPESAIRSFTTMVNTPDPATNPVPADGVNNQLIDVDMQWSSGSTSPTSYHLYLGTDNPPTNLITNLDLGLATTYFYTSTFAFDTAYYWQIVPYNLSTPATNCPIWSFVTTNTETIQLPQVNGLNTNVEVTGLSGLISLSAAVSWDPPQPLLPPVGLFYTITGTTFNGMLITINHNETFVPMNIAYRILPASSWTFLSNPGSWTSATLSFIVSPSRADGDLEIALPADGDITLPVELSSFTAVVTNDYYVRLDWTTQSEAGISGYYLLRNSSSDLSQAERINAFINATNTSSETRYSFTDMDVTSDTWYYWLQVNEMNGISDFYGPTSVLVTNPGNNDSTPIIPLVAGFQNVFPNPFQDTNTITYGLTMKTDVSLRIYNLKGEIIRDFGSINRNPGTYRITWNGRDKTEKPVSTGIYYVKMIIGNKTYVNKLVLLK